LDSGTVTPETSFVDTGSIVVGGQYIYNWIAAPGAAGYDRLYAAFTQCLPLLDCHLRWDRPNFTTTFRLSVSVAGPILTWPRTDLAIDLPGDNDWYEVNLAQIPSARA
jgi:hypothetical protein